MTLGRTTEGAIKIKTDGEAGLRAVSCGCCCSFDAFSPTEGAPKFKYLTYEYNLPLYDLGNLDYGRESWRLECAPAGDDFTCSAVSNAQAKERQKASHKITQFLKADGNGGCSCHVVKAQGNHERNYESLIGDDSCWYGLDMTCWNPGSYRAFIAEIQDAEWSTWQDPETLQLYLNERTREAKWESSFCAGWDWENYFTGSFEGDPPVPVFAWRPGPSITEHCPTVVACANSGQEPGWQFSSPLEGGGFKIRQRVGTYNLVTYDAGYNSVTHTISFTEKQTLHNTLKEIWGSNQLEMR